MLPYLLLALVLGLVAAHLAVGYVDAMSGPAYDAFESRWPRVAGLVGVLRALRPWPPHEHPSRRS